MAITAAWLALTLAGCGSREIFPVHGQIVDENGAPVTELKGGAVEFESVDGKSSANSPIDEEGRYKLTTATPGDGARVGKNRVAIVRPYIGPDTPTPRVILPKYDSPTTSGIEVDVQPKENEINLTVVRVGGPKR